MVPPRIVVGNVTIDKGRFEVWVGEERIELTFVEFELLYALARNAGRVVPRSRLKLDVWNEHTKGDDRKLTVHFSRLRKKLRTGGSVLQIETVKKRGYMLTLGTEREEASLATQARLVPARYERSDL
ncbi:MAG: winged helix-turn-helix domain-containing protein [Dehalococcoidia bacterium]